MRARPRRSFAVLLIAAQLSGPAGLFAQAQPELPPVSQEGYDGETFAAFQDQVSCNQSGTDIGTGFIREDGTTGGLPPQSPGLIGAPTFNSGAGTVTAWGRGWYSDNDQFLTFDSTYALTWVDGAGAQASFFNVRLSTFAPIVYASPVSRYQVMTAQAIAPGRPVQVMERDTDGTTRLFQVFESTAILRLATLTDRNGNTNTYTRDGQGRLTQVTDVHGRYFQMTYTSGFVSGLTDSGGRTTTYGYDGQGRRTSESGPVGTIGYAYDAQNRMTQISYPNGGVRNYTYDAQGRVLTQDDGNGQNAVSYAYYGSSTVVTDALGRSTKYDFIQSQGLKKTAKITDASGGVTGFIYDQNLNLVSQIDPLGRVTRYSYDARGNVTATVDASGASTKASYEPVFNKPIQVTDALGRQTGMSYDNQGNLTQVRDPLSNVTQMSYDGIGHVTQSVDPLSHATNFGYDGNGALSSVADPLSDTTQLTNDALSRVTRNTDPTGKATNYEYDAAGDLTKVTDALNNVTSYGYGPGRTSKLLTSVTDANGHTTSFEYDGQGRQTKVTNALGQFKTSAYDAKSNLITTHNARGQAISYVYDSLDRPIKKILPEGTITYTYDAAGNITQLTHYNGSSIRNSYDALNRLTQNIQTLPNGYQATIGYAYDASGNRTSMTTPWGTFSYAYDSDNRLIKITNPQNQVFTFAYDSAGRRSQMNYPNGVQTVYIYDNADHLMSITATRISDLVIVSSIAYTYDGMGNRTSMTDGEGTHTYSYDDLHRLTNVTHPSRTALAVQNETFTYDSTGNRLADSTITGYTYDVSNRLISNSSFTYTFDADGNQLSKMDANNNQTSFSFDSQNELISATPSNGISWIYKYDGSGRRVEKSSGTAPAQTIYYVYDGLNVLAMINGANSYIAVFTNGVGIDEHLGMHSSADHFFSTDGILSIRVLTDATGSLIESYAYQGFGLMQPRDSLGNVLSESKTGNPFGFTGSVRDSEIGADNYRARTYDALIGRFDRADKGHAVNLYTYVDNSPPNYIDPGGTARCVYSIGLHTMYCVSNDGTDIATLGPEGLYSGIGACRNSADPTCLKSSNLGAIPPGNYKINNDTRPGHDDFFRLEPVPSVSWWEYYLGIKRSGFELHPGTVSLGCITANVHSQNTLNDYPELRDLLKSEAGTNTLEVVPEAKTYP